MDSGTKKMNNVLIKSEWCKNAKAIFAIPERRLFSPTAQDILRERIKSRADVFFSMFPPTLGDTILISRVPLRTLNIHMSEVLTY